MRMNVQRLSDHIWQLGVTMLAFPVHVWLVKNKEGLTLVDAGVGSMSRGIVQKIHALGEGQLKRVVLTHGHPDHVGALRAIYEQYPNVPVYAHEMEIWFAEGRMPYPKRKKAQPFFRPGLLKPLEGSGHAHLKPIEGLQPYWTPGHAPGHTVYYHEQDRVLLTGDLFTSKKGSLKPPMRMFTAYMDQAVKSGEIVKLLQPKLAAVSHGQVVQDPGAQYDEYRQAAVTRYKLKL